MTLPAKTLSLPLYALTFIAMLLGILAGLALGPKAAILGTPAGLIIGIIKAFATPLLFITIFDAMLGHQLTGRRIGRMGIILAINTIAAMGIGLAVVHFVTKSGALAPLFAQLNYNDAVNVKTLAWTEVLKSLVPESLIGPFLENNIPGAVVLAVVMGFAGSRLDLLMVTRLQEFSQLALKLVTGSFRVLVFLIPIAVFGGVAKAVGGQGLSVFQSLFAYAFACSLGLFLHVVIVYQGWIKIICGMPLSTFWHHAKEPALYAFGINSSLATLPVTLRKLDDLQVSPSSARLGACLGTNLNNDGILLYQVVAVLMIAQGLGHDLSLGEQLTFSAYSLLTTLGVAGVPEAGMIALTLVMQNTGLPLETIPLLLSVDWFVARLRSVTNVLGDMSLAIAIDGRPSPQHTFNT